MDIVKTDMTKAEEALKKAYPGDAYYYIGSTGGRLFKEGYEQAEKDCALTPEDIKVIFYLVRRLQYKYSDISGCFEEALELFNKARENEQA